MRRKVFMILTGHDTGGLSIRTVEAFRSPRAKSDWEVRSMVASRNYIRYPTDLPYHRRILEKYYDEADLAFISSTLHAHDWYDDGQGKPTLLIHHGWHESGTHFKHGALEVAAQATEASITQVGSTVNLELLRPLGPPGPGTVTWAPGIYDVDALAALRRRLYTPDPDGVIRVVHAPTDREVKSTPAFIEAVGSLKAQGLKVEGILIEHRTHDETLQIKAKYADVLMDQLKLGYGNNAIEAWCMGIPVIGGVYEHPDWRKHMVSRYNLAESPTGLPFYEANEANLAQIIKNMAKSRELRLEWGQIGLTHVQRHHDIPVSVARMSEIFSIAAQIPSVPSDVSLGKRRRRALHA